uniref:RecQ-mediated genome instability protein 1 n=1 Tax=Steinernema glaseri TaxID=37863 RepID=A0A1I8A3R1_9BILA
MRSTCAPLLDHPFRDDISHATFKFASVNYLLPAYIFYAMLDFESMGDAEIQRFFSSYHIELKEEWRQKAVDFVAEKRKQDQKVKTLSLASHVFEQWLQSDIAESTHPKLRIPSNASKLSIVTKLPVQIVSVMDISKPLYAQYRSVMKRARNTTDNAEFRSEVDYDDEELKYDNRRETLLLMLSDGQTTVKGLQYTPIPNLAKNTPPGTKLLGGNCSRLMKEHTLVYELAKRLRIDTSEIRIAEGERVCEEPSYGLQNHTTPREDCDRQDVHVAPIRTLLGGNCSKLMKEHTLVYELAKRLRIDTSGIRIAEGERVCEEPSYGYVLTFLEF